MAPTFQQFNCLSFINSFLLIIYLSHLSRTHLITYKLQMNDSLII